MSPATIQWLMETCLGDLSMNCCIIYLDDIVIYSKDPASHLMGLEVVLQKLKAARLKLKLSKCELFHKQITYLGHIVFAQEIPTDLRRPKLLKSGPLLPELLREGVS